MDLSESYKKRICELAGLNEVFNPHQYNRFSDLTEQDLYNIAKWGLLNDFSSSGAWDCANNNENEIEKAINCVIEGFKLLLKDKFPDGFAGIPNELNVYRMIVLNSEKDFNKNNVGYSWFTNPNRIENPDFKQQMWHLKTENLYLITAKINQNQIDIPRSLFQRDIVHLENEIVLKSDTNINIISLNKI